MALFTPCQTPDTRFRIQTSDTVVSCEVILPKPFRLSKREAQILEANIHNAMELVLAPYFRPREAE